MGIHRGVHTCVGVVVSMCVDMGATHVDRVGMTVGVGIGVDVEASVGVHANVGAGMNVGADVVMGVDMNVGVVVSMCVGMHATLESG